MTQQFTASEVRAEANEDGLVRKREMLHAYADLLEAQEKAVPVAYILTNSTIVYATPSMPINNGTPLYTHPASDDAERLAEALRELVVACEEHDAMVSRIIGHPAGWNAQYLNSARQALAAHTAQAQPPATSVTDAVAEPPCAASADIAPSTTPTGCDAMNDLDTLRPEVREALQSVEFACTVRYSGEDEYAIIRAELLRLAAMEHTWQQWIKDGMRVEFLPLELPK